MAYRDAGHCSCFSMPSFAKFETVLNKRSTSSQLIYTGVMVDRTVVRWLLAARKLAETQHVGDIMCRRCHVDAFRCIENCADVGQTRQSVSD